MKAPGFWYRPAGAAAMLLDPAAALYELGGAVRQRLAKPHHASVPVVCVGNLVAGGAGKTPVAISIGRRLSDLGVSVHFLTRGYRGREAGPVAVDPDRHTARDVGDEPLLLATHAPTWVARDREAGARAAAAAGAGAIVMDDGLQNPTLAKDLALLVVDGETAFGNGRILPAGPLREPIRRALTRVQAIVMMGEDATGIGGMLAAGPLPVLSASLVPDGDASRWRGARMAAFAGIGRPEKFFALLDQLGCSLIARIAYADHHAYQAQEVARMIDLAEAGQAGLVTTAKDYVRVPAALRSRIQVLPVRVAWESEAMLDRVLEPVVRMAEEARDGV